MISHPAILALLIGSVLVSFMLAYASGYGFQIIRRWDLQSGSELQLSLERRTYLISTLMNYAFTFELLSLFLFIYTADHLHPLFVGAMCAAGTLNLNSYGYPALGLKVMNSLLAGLWLIINFVDNRGFDYPLIRKKYLLLLVMAPLILAETIIQGRYFFDLKPDVITSCCGTLFTSEIQGIASGIVTFPRTPVEILFYGGMALTFFLAIFFYRTGRGAYLFSLTSGFTFLISLIAFISFICLYFYEIPTHHCPFCVLQGEYFYVGYPSSRALGGGGIGGRGAGVLRLFQDIKSLKEFLPSVQRKFTLLSLLAYALFGAIAIYGMVFSNLKM
jgi:hypothetical protein